MRSLTAMQFGSLLIMLKPLSKALVDLKTWVLVDRASSQIDTPRDIRRVGFRISISREQFEALRGSDFHCYRVNLKQRVNILWMLSCSKTDNRDFPPHQTRYVWCCKGIVLVKPTTLAKGA